MMSVTQLDIPLDIPLDTSKPLCVICYDLHDATSITTPCFHTFHKICLKPWFELKQHQEIQCPSCRSNISTMQYEILDTLDPALLGYDTESEVDAEIDEYREEYDENLAVDVSRDIGELSDYQNIRESPVLNEEIKILDDDEENEILDRVISDMEQIHRNISEGIKKILNNTDTDLESKVPTDISHTEQVPAPTSSDNVLAEPQIPSLDSVLMLYQHETGNKLL